MNLVPRFSTRPGAVTGEAIDALRAVEALGSPPVVLGYHPVARTNPFQALLYRRAAEQGFGTVGVVAEEGIDELARLAAGGLDVVLHLHWMNHPGPVATTAAEAEADAAAFLARLDRFRDAGGRLAWTVHNILSHRSRFEEVEASLRKAIADRAEVVHVMAARTSDLVQDRYPLPPDRILHVPHPSYLGAYEDYLSRFQARHQLGLMPDEIVLVALGSIRANKGLSQLIDAWDELPMDPPRRLLIAGAPTEEPGVRAVLERAAVHPRILLAARTIPPQQVQLYLRAADVAVLPYTRVLNSGALMLALTFGLPAIVPADTALADIVDRRFAVTFVPDRRETLVGAILEADGLRTAEAGAAARAAAVALDPDKLSERFATGLRDRLFGPKT